MATRIDLTENVMQQALELLRSPKSLEATAREMGIDKSLLRNNLDRGGMLDEFKGRRFSSTPLEPTKLKSWDKSIANKYLQMKLRARA